MVPAFTNEGFLPVGIHSASIEEFKERFVYGSRRIEIFNGLLRLFDDLKSIGCNVVYIDGSFTSEKVRPNDADVCWDMIDDPAFINFAKMKCPVIFKTAYPRSEQKAKYLSDVLPANVKENASGLMFLKYFQRIKNTNEPKGIIKIELL